MPEWYDMHMTRHFYIFSGVIAVMLVVTGVWYVLYLQKAHSTFENYYAFRGCVRLIERTDTYGTCSLADGTIIKIVLYQGKWFLDGDLPGNGWF